jgi:hypothetical protein
MSKQPWILFFLLLAGVASCNKTASKQSEKASASLAQPSTPTRPCPGTAAKVRETCGCNPVDNSLITVVETLQINQTIKSRVQTCAQGKFGLDVTSAMRAKGEFQSCVTQDTEVPKEVMVQLMSAVDQATQDSTRHQQELSSWLVCYELQTGVYAEKKANPGEVRSCTPDDIETCWKGCDKKDSRSCATLGGVYLQGDRVTKDPKRAEIFYQRACDNNDAESCRTLALLYFNGKDLPEDQSRASSLFTKACQLGDKESCTPPKKYDPLEGRH